MAVILIESKALFSVSIQHIFIDSFDV